ncbi:MAG: hypothetical protein JWL59_3104 [Chthoniobacteraceae bacterium]|nr:hypothetical protein [Chthoniobacteraceae bacterium]
MNTDALGKCDHQLRTPLLLALKRLKIRRSENKNANQVLNRALRSFSPETRSAPLDTGKVTALSEYFVAIAKSVTDGQFSQAEFENLERLRDGRLEMESNAVGSYLSYIEKRIREVMHDALKLRCALEAKAHCFELESRWLEAIPVLREIITIEEDRLFDPVEGARTRARAAQAYIKDWKRESCESAKTLLIGGLERIERLKTVRRTKVELLLTLAHAHIGLDEHQICRVILTKCEPLLTELRLQQAGDSYIALGADYDVRMGVALKRLETDMEFSHRHLTSGALARAKIQNRRGTAHAIRHLGGLYADSSPKWVDRRSALKRSLWFYLAAWDIFQSHGEEGQTSRTHRNCGNVLKYLWEESLSMTAAQQKAELATFFGEIGSSLQDDEKGALKSLYVEIGKISAIQSITGKFAYTQSFAIGALAHYRRSLELKERLGITRDVDEITKDIALIESGSRPITSQPKPRGR